MKLRNLGIVAAVLSIVAALTVTFLAFDLTSAGTTNADGASRVEGTLATDTESSGLVYDRETGRVLYEDDPDKQLATQSLVKLVIALDALDHGGSTATVHHMLAASDDDIASRLWVKYGSTKLVTKWAKRIGLRSTTPPNEPGMWGETRTTANDLRKVYQYILEQATPRVRTVIMNALRDTNRRAADGTDQHFGIPRAVSTRSWAVKQGWACCAPNRSVHTTGVVGSEQRYIAILLTEHHSDLAPERARKRTTRMARSMLDHALPG